MALAMLFYSITERSLKVEPWILSAKLENPLRLRTCVRKEWLAANPNMNQSTLKPFLIPI